MDTVKADPYGSQAEKFEWLDAIPDLTLSATVIDDILIMEDQAWAETRQEALAILGEAMSAEIRESEVLAARRQLRTKVALDTPEKQSNVIVAITEDLIEPNTFPDEARTESERQAAVDAVEPVVVTIEALLRKPLPTRLKIVIQQIGLALILLLMVVVTYHDVLRYYIK